METDRRGLALSTTSPSAAVQYRDSAELFLLGRPGAQDGFASAVQADPDFAEAHVGLAFSAIYEGDNEATKRALSRAQACASTERARGQVALVRGLSELNARSTRRDAMTHLAAYPSDDLAREAAGLVFLLLGMSATSADLYDWLAPTQGDDWSFTGSWSFSCHEMGRLDEARRLGELALADHPDHAFAVHSLTHVAYESGRHIEGASLLTAFLADNEPILFHQRHLRWHLALHLLTAGDQAGVRALWSSAVAPDATAIRLGAVEDGAGLLWRWHLYNTGGWELPWGELGDLARDIAQLPVAPLPSACAVVVLAALDEHDTLDTLLANAESIEAAGLPAPTPVLRAVATAATASFSGDWNRVADALLRVRGQFWRIGGSRAQREVFDEALLFGLVWAGRGDEAVPLLQERLGRRPSDRESRLLATLT